MGFELLAAGIGAAATIYGATQARKKPGAPSPGAPPVPVDGGPDAAKKRKAYRPAAQLFRDEDLRLGVAGKLGL